MLSRLITIVVLIFINQNVSAQESPSDVPNRVEITDFIPYGREPVDYFSPQTNDAISRLQMRLATVSKNWDRNAAQGYLSAVLKELQIAPESQVLVFSKTARNPDLISPKTPRAIYFNDEVMVGWVPHAIELEFTAIDPVKGINFYTLSQPMAAVAQSDKSPNAPSTLQFQRKDQCLACHAGRSTFEVPGFLLRAFQTDASGKPIMGYSVMNQDSPYAHRWGGWFVVGTPPGFDHRGNLLTNRDNERDRDEPGFRAARTDLKDVAELKDYLISNSDVIAHLVLAHQTQCLNLMARVGIEARYQRRSDAEDKLIRCLVFADEPPLPKPLDPNFVQQSVYRKHFEAREPLNADGHSLRQFDLQTRVFRHRLSYLIHHPLMQGLPNDCRARLLSRLRAGLTQRPVPKEFVHLTEEERLTLVKFLPTP